MSKVRREKHKILVFTSKLAKYAIRLNIFEFKLPRWRRASDLRKQERRQSGIDGWEYKK